jgi:hypothetical protein
MPVADQLHDNPPPLSKLNHEEHGDHEDFLLFFFVAFAFFVVNRFLRVNAISRQKNGHPKMPVFDPAC